MAKFTVYFKDKATQCAIFDVGVVHIGRDDTNNLVVDSLAVAPAHAVVIVKDNQCVIKQLNDKFPLVINNQATPAATLQNNDVINVGKHSIVFNNNESIMEREPAPAFINTENETESDLEILNDRLEENSKSSLEANLQIMDGPHIGRILPLKKSMTRLGQEGGCIAVIARRKDGYFLSALKGHEQLSVNKNPIGNQTLQLQDKDIIQLDKTPMQFFLE